MESMEQLTDTHGSHARGHYMMGLMDGIMLVNYRRLHIQGESPDLADFKTRMDAEIACIISQYTVIRGSQMADFLTDGG